MSQNDKLYQLFLSHPEVTSDTRALIPNGIFFALKGGNFDGNQFAAQALEGGCAYAVVDNPAVVHGDRYILVDDVLTTGATLRECCMALADRVGDVRVSVFTLCRA